MYLEYSFIENWFINFIQQSSILNHALREFNVRNCASRQVASEVIYENQWVVFYVFFCVCFSQEDLHDGFDWGQWECASSEPLHQVVDGGIDEEEGHLFVWIKGGGALCFLEKSSDILHELIIIKVNAHSTLKLIKLKMFKENFSLLYIQSSIRIASKYVFV